MLLFKKKFLDAIRSGRKTQTVRLWKVRRVRAGQRSYIPGIGYIRILAVDEVALDDLTDEDAELDGFDSARSLREEIQAIYAGETTADYRAYRLRFELAPDEVKRPKQPKQRRPAKSEKSAKTNLARSSKQKRDWD